MSAKVFVETNVLVCSRDAPGILCDCVRKALPGDGPGRGPAGRPGVAGLQAAAGGGTGAYGSLALPGPLSPPLLGCPDRGSGPGRGVRVSSQQELPGPPDVRGPAKSEQGKLIVEEKLLSGVAFYQSELENNRRTITCHGRKSIYGAVVDTIEKVNYMVTQANSVAWLSHRSKISIKARFFGGRARPTG